MQPAVSEQVARHRIWFIFIAILAFAGIVVSAVSLERHYAKSATEFCDLSQKFSCDIVNRSEYSEIAGIPVAGLGVAGYAALFLLATFGKSRPETPTRLLAASVLGLIFALNLTYVEAHVLKTWCVLCLGSQALILLITLLSFVVWFRTERA